MSQHYKELADRISRLEIDLAQLRQKLVADQALEAELNRGLEVTPPTEPLKRGPGRPKKAE